MADVVFSMHSNRAQLARASTYLGPEVVKLLPYLYFVLILSGVLMLVGLGMPLGWILITLGVVVYVVTVFYKDYLHVLPRGGGDDIIDLLEVDILGKLPNNASVLDVASLTGSLPGGRFMAVRLGITPMFINNVATSINIKLNDLWAMADQVRKKNNLELITSAVLTVAIVRCFDNYETLISQIHLSDDDLDYGVRWHQYMVDLAKRHNKPRRTGGIARDWSFGWIPLLERFGQNISQQIGAGGGMLPINVGSHTDTVRQLIETFSAGGRQNAVLVGQSGAGKTTIIHAFAEKLLDASSDIPDTLKFRQVFILDSASLIAAAPGRGELENLVMQVLNEAYRAKNIIICLDNAQLFFEEGVGAVDLSNVLQPILEAGNLRVILSMDEQKYMEVGRRNPALINAINRINVAPTDTLSTMQILGEQIIVVEFQRKVTFMLQALNEAYRLSERYIHELVMPGRAIKLAETSAGFSESGLVTINSVQQAIEKTLDIKVSVASESEDREKLLNMESLIHKRMVNQSRAVSVVSDALRRARTGVRNQNRPIGTFLFLGPTGVGKTELSKALADVYFGGENKMIRIDLNEYVRAEDVTRLIADGADDPTSLTAQVIKQPFSVVLFDEIEKAAPEVLSTLLQLLDEGILRDVRNREVSFRDAIIIATSNAGADRIREYIERGYDVAQFEGQFTDELISSGQFRPEFLNRFDEIVVFRPFTKEELVQVLDLILKGVNKTLEPQKISVEVDDESKQILVEKGYDPRLGARPMRRVVQKAVENTIAKLMLAGSVNPGDTIYITADQVKEVFNQPANLG